MADPSPAHRIEVDAISAFLAEHSVPRDGRYVVHAGPAFFVVDIQFARDHRALDSRLGEQASGFVLPRQTDAHGPARVDGDRVNDDVAT